MRKHIAYVIAAAMAITAAVPSLAADNIKTRDAQLRSDFTIVVDGREVGFRSADGKAVYPVLYNGSTYLPLRAVGELMGKNVNWDEQNKVVNLSGRRDSVSLNSGNEKIGKKMIRVQERPDFTIMVDNEEKTFKSALGREIYPVLYNGSTYLPLRSIGEIMHQDVVWDGREKKITLGTSGNGFTVTDADSFQSQSGTTNGKEITREKAKEIALDHAGLKPSEVSFVRAEREVEKGKVIYDLEFVAGKKEYEYEIDAKTGKILKYDFEVKPNGDTSSNKKITLEEAKSIALKHAGVKADEVSIIKAKTDTDDGKLIYEFDFYVKGDKYEYEIDAETGKILKCKSEPVLQKPDIHDVKIGLEKAKKIALDYLGLDVSQVKFSKVKEELDDGVVKYELELIAGDKEYEFEINADGKILDFEKDD